VRSLTDTCILYWAWALFNGHVYFVLSLGAL